MEFVNSDIWQQLFVRSGPQIEWWAEVVRSVLRLVIGLAAGLGSVPILVWLERRLLGWLQGRLGPNRVGPYGLLQPVADALKLMMKEDITPTNVDRVLYFLAPAVALAPVVMSLVVLPWNGSRDWGAIAPRLDSGGILVLLAIASIEVYGVILAGWASNNKYSLLGGLRASSQVISYELGMGLAVMAVLLLCGTLSTQGIVSHQGRIETIPIPGSAYTVEQQSIASGFWNWNLLALFPFGLIAAGIYMVSMIAETNRAPFDLPEAETELVAGFHTEYSSFKFAMFFMGEYANMLVVSAICVTLFFGGYLAPWGPLGQLPASAGAVLPPWLVNLVNHAVLAPFWLVVKLYALIAFFIWVRATFPRLRYDMLMKLGWKAMLPTALVNVFLIALSIALQQTLGILGHLAAVGAGALLLAVLFQAKRRTYQAQRPAGKTDALVPIRREPTATPTAAKSAPEG